VCRYAEVVVLVLAATKLISNYTNHLAQTPLDSFMKGAEWSAPGKLKPPPNRDRGRPLPPAGAGSAALH
jgi:hypothetical protein